MSMQQEWRFRVAGPEDVPALAALYAQIAARCGPACYTPQQVRAWVSFGADTPRFRDYVLGATTWIAEAGGDGAAPDGFCGIDSQGELRSFYVRTELQRRGLGTRLLRHAMAHAQGQGLAALCAWATPLGRPVFERAGFHLERVVREPFEGVEFDRFRMRFPDRFQ